MMVLILVLSFGFLIFSILTLKTGNSVVKVGYGDIGRYQGGEWSSMKNAGGYRDDNWAAMLTYPVFAVVLGFIHNILVVKIYQRRGSSFAKVFAGTSLLVMLAGLVVLMRLIGEG